MIARAINIFDAQVVDETERRDVRKIDARMPFGPDPYPGKDDFEVVATIIGEERLALTGWTFAAVAVGEVTVRKVKRILRHRPWSYG